MIQADNLTHSYGGELVFEGASFTIGTGERCGLVGRNGSGKTTLLRLLTRQEEPDKGRLSFSRGYRIGYLDQHIRFSRPTVLEEALLGLKEEESEAAYKAEKLLFGLGFTEEQMDLDPALLSGGYHLRLHLAKVLLSEPDCLLLDEPTNYLDILSIRFLTQLLQEWKGELILVSHDREFLDEVITHTLGIHRKKMKKVEGTTVDYFNQILLDEEVYEKTRVGLEKKRAHMESFVERFGAKASKAGQARSRKKMIERIPALEELKKLYSLDFNFHERPFPGEKMVDVKGINFFYEKEKELIQNLSLVIEKGERIAIVGKNGYGKSTLLRLLARELTPVKGEIVFSDQASIGYFGQTHIQRLAEDRTIEMEISEANTRLPTSDVRRICGQMMFSGDLAKKRVGVLSGGEKSRVLLGKILAKPCNLLLLDEPTHHLDIESVEALIDALEDFEGAVVLVTHSELILKRLHLDKLIVCHQAKQQLFLGSYEEFLEKIGWEEEEESAPKKTLSKQEIVQPKSSKSLEKEILRLEEKLLALEIAQEEDFTLLADASARKDLHKIQELTKRTRERSIEIEQMHGKIKKARSPAP